MEKISATAGPYIPPTPVEPPKADAENQVGDKGAASEVKAAAKKGSGKGKSTSKGSNQNKEKEKEKDSATEELKELGKSWRELSPDDRKAKCLALLEPIYKQSLHWETPDDPPLLSALDSTQLQIGDVVVLDVSPLKDGKRHAGDQREEYVAIITKADGAGWEVQDVEENEGEEFVEDKKRFVHVVDAAAAFSDI